MPCMEITLPKTELSIKQKLATTLSLRFEESTNISADIFAIKFNEYEEGTSFVGGEMITSTIGNSRPYIHCLLYSPRLSKSIKSDLGNLFTETFIEAFNDENWWPVIHICEHPYDNVVVNGQLLSNTYDHCKKATFYYDLEDES